MHWLWGILLGIVLTAALPLLAGVLCLSDRIVNERDAMLVAIALVTFCLLGVLIFRPAGTSRLTRPMSNRYKEED
ncbi:MAG: hypothetical protein GTO55_06185 [Armatimonadetes bacterium]|nr:hypothetical protein [Armatimonadota bacterium]NIM23840.1 hypothetical protein [Armatimonadota bacterium]NIM67719.1 hypothetical protein [Armatimonadota bacterium]NIM76228.1 hypothetical protein [Armatimonadota bacterium]NIN05921.1 hypothetical protein [Armatimonadota bacterium]